MLDLHPKRVASTLLVDDALDPVPRAAITNAVGDATCEVACRSTQAQLVAQVGP